MNFRILLSLTLVITIPAFAAEKSRYESEKEQKERWRKESEQEAKAQAATPVEEFPRKYPQAHRTLKDLQAKVYELGNAEITPEERLKFKLSAGDLHSEINKRGIKKLTEDERLLLDTLMFGELAETYGEAGGIQGQVCQFLTGWHEVGQFKGHHGVVNVLTTYNMFNSSNQDDKLISGGQDGTVKIWDIHTQKCEHTLPTYTDPRVEGPLPIAAVTTIKNYDTAIADMLAVAYRAPGSISLIKIFKLYKKKAPTLIKILHGPLTITHLDSTFNADHEQELLSFSSDGNMQRWNIEKGGLYTQTPGAFGILPAAAMPGLFAWNPATRTYQCTAVPAHTPVAFSNPLWLHYSHKEKAYRKELFASGDTNGTIYVWDAKNPACVATLHAHTAKITALRLVQGIRYTIDPDVECSCACESCETEKKRGEPIGLRGLSHCQPCQENRLEALGKHSHYVLYLISASEDGTLRLWEMLESERILPAVITQDKKAAEEPESDSDEEGCGSHCGSECTCSCHNDSDTEEETEKEEKEEKEKESKQALCVEE